MATDAFGGNSSPNSYTDDYMYSGGVGISAGRIMANGQGPKLLSAGQVFASGRGAARNCTLSIGSMVSSFAIASAGSAQSTGYQNGSYWLVPNGTSDTVIIDCDGSFYGGRGGGGDTYDSYGYVGAGTLGGVYGYTQGPTAPQSVTAAATVNPGEVKVDWLAPSDNGGDPITGYVVEWATNAGFTTGTGSATVGNVLTKTVSGLTPGTTYYFRVKAKNAVTTYASTTSVASSTVIVGTVSGVKVWNGSAWVTGTVKVWDGSAWVPATVRAWNGSAWVPTV